MPGIQIIGGGSNKTARVDDTGKLETLSAVLNVSAVENIENENSYIITQTLTPSADSEIFYIKNLQEDPMIIVASEWYCDSNEVVKLYRNPTGTPTDGTSLNPVNCNFGSNKLPSATFSYGTNLGGISGLGVNNLRNIIRLQAGVPRRYNFDNWTILTRNSSFVVNVQNGSSEIDFWFQFFMLTERF